MLKDPDLMLSLTTTCPWSGSSKAGSDNKECLGVLILVGLDNKECLGSVSQPMIPVAQEAEAG